MKNNFDSTEYLGSLDCPFIRHTYL